MKTGINFRATFFLLSVLGCAGTDLVDDGSSRPENLAAAASGETLNQPPICTPNLGSDCSTGGQCTQCAFVLTPFGVGEVLIRTKVQCLRSACVRTGCPVDACPEGTSCMGCAANLACRCTAAAPSVAGSAAVRSSAFDAPLGQGARAPACTGVDGS